MTEPTVTGRVRLSADFSDVPNAARAAQGELAKIGDAAKESGEGLDDLADAAKRSEFSTGRLTDAAKRMAPSLTGLAVAAAQGNVNLGNLASSALAAASAFGPWGIAIGVAGTALFALTEKQREAAKAADELTEKIEKQRKALADLEEVRRRDARRATAVADVSAAEGAARKAELAAVARIEGERQKAIDAARDEIAEQEKQIAVNKQLGVSTEQNLRRVAEAREVIAMRSGELDEAEKIRHDEEIRRIDAETAALQKKGKQVEKLTELEIALAQQKRRFDAGLSRAIDDQIVAQGNEQANLPFEDDEGFKLRDEQFKEARAQAERNRIKTLEDLKDAAHKRELERQKEEKKELEETQRMREKVAGFAADQAGAAIVSSLSIAKARREAVAAARLQGKTEAEAARMGKVAELEARASRMEGIRNMAILKSLEHSAEAIGAFARQDYRGGALHLAAAAAFGALAGVAAARANTLESAASNTDRGGFGAGAGGFGGGAANGPFGGSANTGPSPVDSPIPGSPGASPIPKPGSSGSQQGGAVHYHFHGDVYGQPRRQFVEDFDRELANVGHSRRRAG